MLGGQTAGMIASHMTFAHVHANMQRKMADDCIRYLHTRMGGFCGSMVEFQINGKIHIM